MNFPLGRPAVRQVHPVSAIISVGLWVLPLVIVGIAPALLFLRG